MLHLFITDCNRSEPKAKPLSCVQSLPCTKHLLLLFFATLLTNAHLRTHNVLCARGETQQEKLEIQKKKNKPSFKHQQTRFFFSAH